MEGLLELLKSVQLAPPRSAQPAPMPPPEALVTEPPQPPLDPIMAALQALQGQVLKHGPTVNRGLHDLVNQHRQRMEQQPR
jgi:hypothetical protein